MAGDDNPDGNTAVDGGPDIDAAADASMPVDRAERLFAGSSIARFEITLPPEALYVLSIVPDQYVRGQVRVEIDGESVERADVGVRLKGRYGSFRTMDAKAAFLLKLDEFVNKQTLFGLEKLALNNMIQDPSMIHERLGYSLFRALGVAAPRSGYARVYVNGALYGLYSTVEAVDDDTFLESWFGDSSGTLFEGEYGSDLEPHLVSSFDLDRGDALGFAKLHELALALDSMTPDTFFTQAAQYIDMNSYLLFAATEIFLGHWDGYAWTRNNYFLYQSAMDGRWVFMPWGIDQTLWDSLDPLGGGGRLQAMCMASQPCREALARAYEQVIAQVAALELEAEAEALRALIWEAAVEDPRKEVSDDTIAWSIDSGIEFLRNRPADVQARLACLDPAGMDVDGDGAPGCGYDCNDQNPAVYPGAPEQCNLVDDDCDGVLDNDPRCPPCASRPGPQGVTLLLCVAPRIWWDAEADCVAQGGHLASIHSQEMQDAVRNEAFAIAQGDWWIGLNDGASEGSFTWSDGSPLDYSAWAVGEPNNWEGEEDCAHMTGWGWGAWNDIDCYYEMNYVCALP